MRNGWHPYLGGTAKFGRDRDRCSEIADVTIPYSNCSKSIKDSWFVSSSILVPTINAKSLYVYIYPYCAFKMLVPYYTVSSSLIPPSTHTHPLSPSNFLHISQSLLLTAPRGHDVHPHASPGDLYPPPPTPHDRHTHVPQERRLYRYSLSHRPWNADSCPQRSKTTSPLLATFFWDFP